MYINVRIDINTMLPFDLTLMCSECVCETEKHVFVPNTSMRCKYITLREPFKNYLADFFR